MRTIKITMGLALLTGLFAGCARPGAANRCSNSNDCEDGEICDNGECVPWQYVDAGPQPDGSQQRDAAGPRPDGSDSDAEINCVEAHFEETQTQEIFYVPDGAVYMHVKAWGSGGNQEGSIAYCGYDTGGLGGYSEAVFRVTPGDPLIIIVGAPGSASHQGQDVVRFGFGSSGGGGLSGVFEGPDFLTEYDWDKALVIAGGGGGAGWGPDGDRCRAGGTGNHLTESGGNPGTMMGGIGLDDGVNGGGGGHEGGAGGAVREWGHGGTGHLRDNDPNYIDGQTLYSERGSGLPPKTDDVDYIASGTDAGRTETGGLVVIHFVCTIPPVM